MTSIAIILPAFNEELTIAQVVEDFHTCSPNAEIWVVDNCSTDSTRQKALAVFDKHNINGGVLNEPRKGKGNALRCAFTKVEADIYVMCDADCTYHAKDMDKLLHPVKAGEADMVIGDRHGSGDYAKENKRAMHGFGNGLVRNLVNYLFKAKLTDILSGYRVFSRRFIKTYPVLVEGFEVETDMTLHALDKRLNIVEIPIEYTDRPLGSVSKLNTYRDGYRVLKTLSNILRHYRPLAFFGSLAIIFFVAGLIIGFPVIDQFVRTRLITRIPLAILSTGVEIIAVMLAAIGAILDSIVYNDKRMFERELMQYGKLIKSKALDKTQISIKKI